MPYELTCPSCHARLLLKADAGDEHLLCPRCLNVVPRPDGRLPATAARAADTRVSVRPTRAVSSAAADLRRAIWPAYFIILALVVLTTIGVILVGVTGRSPQDWQFSALFALVIVLTVLALYPIGKGLAKGLAPSRAASPGSKALRTIAVIVLLLIIAPFAFAVVFFTVCTATILKMVQ